MMKRLTPRGLLSSLAAIALALVVAQVAVADTSVSESGIRGTHSLRDTNANPGATCKYTTTFQGGGGWAGNLTRLYAEPPRMWASSGTHTVGWRFRAQRKLGSGAWSTTYTSGIWKATATTTTRASFTRKTINVNLPADYGDVEYYYRILIDMFWYAADGTTLRGSSTHRVEKYQRLYGTFEYERRKGICKDSEVRAP